MDKEYHARKSREWYARQTPEQLAERKLRRSQSRRDAKSKAVAHMGGKCHKCGQTFPDCCFDFHHVNPLDHNEVPSSVLMLSWKRILEELSKCIMVCSNCHRIIHNEDGYLAHSKRD